MDANSFRADQPGSNLESTTLDMTRRREDLLGPAYRLFYSNPVHLVRGEGTDVWDADGNRYLDVYNNVVSLGHCHPAVVEAVHQQMQTLNTHTRYLHGAILDYAADFLATMPAPSPGRTGIGNIMFQCTGSEANDLALRVARAATGHSGVIVTSEAYHGATELTALVSPSLGSGVVIGDVVRLVDAPDFYREGPGAGARFAADVKAAITDLQSTEYGFSALLIDSIFSSDGVHSGPSGFLHETIEAVHESGGLFIADEVQPGFGRTGEAFWGFARHTADADIVTTGKPMGNGIPVAAMAARPDVLAAFAAKFPYFNTFGGNPVSIAAAQAVLTTIREDRLQEHALKVGTLVRDELLTLADRHEKVGDVRGSGLFIGLELVVDRASRTPDREFALRVIDEMRERHVLTSVAGPGGNVLKLRPTLAFQESDIDRLVGTLDDVLTALRP
ncbi:aspartate aminotransferase family protein [Citricoccus sp. GCM10030269]|uniref:aspartate aminotransferase family protein n=1 Tax=Citricoccus sp. GCM10030269 TaxID=3273388 RepID=UPI0036062C12